MALQAWAAVASLLVMLPGTLLLESGQIAAVEAAPLAVGACVLFAGVVVSVGAKVRRKVVTSPGASVKGRRGSASS